MALTGPAPGPTSTLGLPGQAASTLGLPGPAGTVAVGAAAPTARDANMAALRTQVCRELAHWRAAIDRLAEHTSFAAPSAWHELETYLGVALRGNLDDAVTRLRARAAAVEAAFAAAETVADLAALERDIVALRRRYTQAETLVAFYCTAVNSRTGDEVGSLLRACDVLARACMATILEPMRLPVPPTLCYVSPGLGASILSAGLRLWDGITVSAVAAIRTTWHNLLTPTSICHEAGHFANSATGWNDELADAFAARLPDDLGRTFAGWAHEIAADAVAFCTTGYGSVAALHDVVAGDDNPVFMTLPLDPHPPPYLRVLLNIAFCRRFYGAGPWDDMSTAWLDAHPLSHADPGDRTPLARARDHLDDVAEIILRHPYRAFGDRPVTALADPMRVRPDALNELRHSAGPALFTSSYWLRREPLRILALSGYRVATEPESTPDLLAETRGWMRRLGALAAA